MFKRFFSVYFSFLILVNLGCGDESYSTLSQNDSTTMIPLWIASYSTFPPNSTFSPNAVTTMAPLVVAVGTSLDDDHDQSGRVPSDYSSYPFGTIGKVESCTAVLLTPRIALTSAHCLMSKELNIFDSSKEALFYISDTSIEIKKVILGTTRISENPMSTERFGDWAFLILDQNTYTSTLKFLVLSRFGISWFTANVFGMNENQNLAYNHETVILESKDNRLRFSKSSGISGTNSGIIVTNNRQIVGLMSSDFELRTPSDSFIVNVAIPMTNSIRKTFYTLKLLFKSNSNPTSEEIQLALSQIRYWDNIKDTLVIYDREQSKFLTLNSSMLKSLPLPFKHPRMYLTKSNLGCYLSSKHIDILIDSPNLSPVIFNPIEKDTLLEQNPKSIASKD